MKITKAQLLKSAGEAEVDPRTVARVYEGKPTRGLVRGRIEAAAKKLKMPAVPMK